jgi:hypothetical protein
MAVLVLCLVLFQNFVEDGVVAVEVEDQVSIVM